MEIEFFKPERATAITGKATPTLQLQMTVSLETITPAIAEQILAGNKDNRPHKERHVKFLADQMRAGAWQITGDPVKISTSGRLLDGQHRLMAIKLSETTQQIYVARDCQEEIFSVLDTGKNRNAADVLVTAGLKNSTALAAAAKILLLHEHGSLGIINKSGRRETTNAAILQYCQTHDLEESTTKAHAWAKRCKLLNPGEWTALHYLFSQKDDQQAYHFLQQISTGLNLTEGHPVFLLRTKLQQARDGRFNFSPAERMALTIKAWNGVREGKKFGHLTWKNYEEFPEII